MLSLAEGLRYQRGNTVVHKGDVVSSVFWCKTGILRAYTQNDKGKSITLRHILPGDFFGEEYFETGVAAYHIEALTKSWVHPVSMQSLKDSDLTQVMLSIGAQIKRAALYHYDLQVGDLRCRLIRYLLELANTPLSGESRTGEWYVKVTHELLAEGTASTRESVSKIITDLKNEGLIGSGYRQITLLQPEVLQHMILEQSQVPQDKPA